MMDPLVALIEEIVNWIGPVFGVAGYPIIGVAVLLERSIFVGLVMPGDVLLALGGVYASRGDLDLGWVMGLAGTAAIVGESAGFWLGRRYGRTIMGKIPFGKRFTGNLAAAEEYFDKHGGKTVAIGRFATAAGTFIPFVAGMSGMRYWRFLAFDVPSVAVWAATITMIGYVFGQNLELVDRILSRFGWIMLGVLVVMVAAIIFVRRRRS